MSQKKLFRMTAKRKIIMDDILTSLTNKIETLEGFGMNVLVTHSGWSKEEKEQKIQEQKAEIEKLKLYHDVLETVICHRSDFYLTLFRYENRSWKNEWEIPNEVFKETIKEVISLIEHYQSRSRQEKHKKHCRERVSLLQELERFVLQSV